MERSDCLGVPIAITGPSREAPGEVLVNCSALSLGTACESVCMQASSFMNGGMRFVSLFAGAGGLDLGLEYAGWRCEYATDIDQAAVETLKINKGKRTGGVKALEHAVIEQADVRSLSGKAILAATSRRRGDFPLLAGGPPCQSWSSAGHQLGLADPRGRLFEDYVRIARELDVRWLLFENVRGLLTARGPDGVPGSALQLIRTTLLNAGWQTTLELLNAADYGVPQRRVRLLLIGYRHGDAPQFPIATHAEREDVFRSKWQTLGECLSQIRPPAENEIILPTGKLAKELATVRPGSGVKSPVSVNLRGLVGIGAISRAPSSRTCRDPREQ